MLQLIEGEHFLSVSTGAGHLDKLAVREDLNLNVLESARYRVRKDGGSAVDLAHFEFCAGIGGGLIDIDRQGENSTDVHVDGIPWSFVAKHQTGTWEIDSLFENARQCIARG